MNRQINDDDDTRETKIEEIVVDLTCILSHGKYWNLKKKQIRERQPTTENKEIRLKS